MLPYGARVPQAANHRPAEHNVREYTNPRNLLPEIYRELGGRIP